MTKIERTTTSEAETEALAAEIARGVQAPLVFLLEGELGAGKTSFVRGFVRALAGGAEVTVQSPTFALARTYATDPPVHHLDLYRLSSAAGLEELGLLELLHDDKAFSFVEWPRDLALSVRCATVRLSPHGADPDGRRLELILP